MKIITEPGTRFNEFWATKIQVKPLRSTLSRSFHYIISECPPLSVCVTLPSDWLPSTYSEWKLPPPRKSISGIYSHGERRRRGRKSAKFYLLNLKYIITSTLITINWQRELLEPLPGAQYSSSSLTFSSYSVSGIWYSQKSYNNKFGVSSFLKKWRFIFLLLLSSSAAAPLPIPFMVGGLTIMSTYALWWCSAVHRVHIMWRWSIGGRERQGDTIITTNNNMSKYIANKATVSPKSDCHAREEGREKHQV